jgi:hypothetical protein
VKATALQSFRQRLTKIAIVVGYQQRRMGFRHSLRSLGGSMTYGFSDLRRSLHWPFQLAIPAGHSSWPFQLASTD